FARELAAYSRQAGVDWALVPAVLRADGRSGRAPATRAGLRSLSLRLARVGGRANGWSAALSYSSNTGFADRVVALRHYCRAVDIAALDGVSIYGHQQPGGLTEQGVRALLMLPGGMLPGQVISLLGLGGPSFPLANHYDHIHVGF